MGLQYYIVMLVASHGILLASWSIKVTVGTTIASWDHDVVDVRQGDNVTVTCTVSHVDLLSVIRLAHSHHSTSVIISDNEDIKQEFRQLGRYRIMFHIFDGIATMIVQINGVRGEDSGLLVCHPLGDDVIAAHVNFNVQVPVKDVYVVQLAPDGDETRIEEHSEMNEVLLVQHDLQGIGCVTSLEGSFLVPSLNVTLGDRDVTDFFQLSTERKSILMESGLTLFDVTVRRTFVTSQPDPYISGQVMTCIAAVQYGSTVATSLASAVVIVHYAPVITCPSHVIAQATNSVTLDCTVRASPGSRVTWSTPIGSERANDLSTHSTILSADESRVFLIIDSVSERHYGNYTLRADNLIGSSMAVVELVRGVISTSTWSPTPVHRVELQQEATPVVAGHRLRSTSDHATGQGVHTKVQMLSVGVATLLSVYIGFLIAA